MPLSEFGDNVGRFYDQKTERRFNQLFYEGSDYANYGYWRPDTVSMTEACENLMEELLAFIPRKTGNILDVACGKGATTRHLLKYYPPEKVVGINISTEQLKRCEINAPGCTFRRMDATSMEFADNSFSNIICVEAAFHFDTREAFLSEAHRVLKRRGRLVLADLLMPETFPRQPKANVIEDLAEYEAVCRRTGFESVEVRDVTEPCVGGYFGHALEFAQQFPALAQRPAILKALSRGLEAQKRTRSYILACCTKR